MFGFSTQCDAEHLRSGNIRSFEEPNKIKIKHSVLLGYEHTSRNQQVQRDTAVKLDERIIAVFLIKRNFLDFVVNKTAKTVPQRVNERVREISQYCSYSLFSDHSVFR